MCVQELEKMAPNDILDIFLTLGPGHRGRIGTAMIATRIDKTAGNEWVQNASVDGSKSCL